jgi:Phenazine biosynthesis-like protein/Patatin-like phospholipase
MSPMSSVAYAFVDVFASRPLTGNPLSLVPDADGLEETQMRAIAREFNQPPSRWISHHRGSVNRLGTAPSSPPLGLGADDLPAAGLIDPHRGRPGGAPGPASTRGVPAPRLGSGAVDDRLAQPISFDARYGARHRRALVLGGGGIVFVAWLTAYLRELARRGVALEDADRIIGTSAGSVLATVVAHRHLHRFGALLRVLSQRPEVIARLAPAAGLKPSQQRALDLFQLAQDAEPTTIRAIGSAALAAATPTGNLLPTSVLAALQTWRWPDDRLAVSAIDAYSGERLALTRACCAPSPRARPCPGCSPPSRCSTGAAWTAACPERGSTATSWPAPSAPSCSRSPARCPSRG